ncbi:copper resistance protein CopC [Actinomadura sp. HBU206391]|nr:copper resistance protein CopC [Actinomadura sp. HBU206391]
MWAASAVVALVLCTATPADAHTTLKEASPGPGTTVSPPARIVLTYGDPVILPQVVLTDASGRRHESGRAQAVDNKVTQQVAGSLAPGVYQVGWRVVAVDGHPVTGEYRFTVRGTPTSGQDAGGGSSAPAPAVTTTARPGASTSGSSSSGWWWIALGTALAALVVAGIALTRRRSD